jgi:hypothetical protein
LPPNNVSVHCGVGRREKIVFDQKNCHFSPLLMFLRKRKVFQKKSGILFETNFIKLLFCGKNRFLQIG